MNHEWPKSIESTKKILPKESIPGDTHLTDYEGQQLDVYKLIHLSEALAEDVVEISSLQDVAQGNYWHDKNGEWLGPHHIFDAITALGGKLDWQRLLSEHPAWDEEIEKIRKADYETYPILMVENTVVDGVHRFTHAVVDGKKTVKVKRFSGLPKEAVYKGS